jgi:flagellar assembly protein FliH
MLSDRLASEARSDALELGLMIARKVVEGELAVNADRLISVVKSAVSRVGESRRIVVHLAPEDADVLNGHGQTGHAGAKDSTEGGAAPVAAPSPIERLGRGAAKIEVVADPSLSRGDCVVEGDHLSVDARLDAKFAEIRRALMESAWEESA